MVVHHGQYVDNPVPHFPEHPVTLAEGEGIGEDQPRDASRARPKEVTLGYRVVEVRSTAE